MKSLMKVLVAAAVAFGATSAASAASTMHAHRGKQTHRMSYPAEATRPYAKAPAAVKPFTADEQREFDRLTGNIANF